MRNYEWCAYTYRHRKAFAYLVEKYIQEPALKKELMKRAEDHDMDKMVMYLYMDQYEAQKAHVMHNAHHLENNLERIYADLVETVIDYESAPYTKEDKPLNAYDFTLKLNEMGYLDEDQRDELLSIMHTFGIDHTGTVVQDTEGQTYMKQFADVSEEMIRDEIRMYLNRHPEEAVPEVMGEL